MNNSNIPEFLLRLDEDPKHYFRKAWWLLTPFEAPVWLISLQYEKPCEINWKVSLDDESILTAPKNRRLETALKTFLIVASAGGSRNPTSSVATQLHHLRRAFYIVDYLLINSKKLKLASCGLSGLSSNELKGMLLQIGSGHNIHQTVYSYNQRLVELGMELISKTPSSTIENLINEIPCISEISSSAIELNELDIPIEKIPSLRAALLHGGFYHKDELNGFHLNSAKITPTLYKNTLKGDSSKPRINILSFYPMEPAYRREYLGVPTRSDATPGLTESSYNYFRSVLNTMRFLNFANEDAPSLQVLEDVAKLKIDLKECGRYRSVPSDVILNQFKDCVEFHFKFGKIIINGFCRLIAYCAKKNISPLELSNLEVQRIIGPKLVKMGVIKFGITCPNSSKTDNGYGLSGGKRNKEFYISLRNNEGLINLLEVYIGCVQIVTGALTARRAKELIDLQVLTCLDVTRDWLIFKAGKTSRLLFGIRDTQARPIDKLAVSMIKELQRMQHILKRIGFIKEYTSLFSIPYPRSSIGLVRASHHTFNKAMDSVGDYFQAPLDSKKRRYYLRQHQLRRFFALFFFHTFGLGGINSLRWMLAHSDIQHAWHYITDTVDGASLRGAKSQYVLEQLNRGHFENFQSLVEILKDRYGTEDVTLIDETEADLYIQRLLQDGDITIEPYFFNDETGQKMMIIVKIINPQLKT
jgi:hypothetical protein